jgi:hypothetical protein
MLPIGIWWLVLKSSPQHEKNGQGLGYIFVGMVFPTNLQVHPFALQLALDTILIGFLDF